MDSYSIFLEGYNDGRADILPNEQYKNNRHYNEGYEHGVHDREKEYQVREAA